MLVEAGHVVGDRVPRRTLPDEDVPERPCLCFAIEKAGVQCHEVRSFQRHREGRAADATERVPIRRPLSEKGRLEDRDEILAVDSPKL